MKTIASVITAVAIFASAPFAVAGPYKSVIIKGNVSTYILEVPAQKAFIVSAFGQDVAGQGSIALTVRINGETTNVLQSTITPDGDSRKDVVIAGPATIAITPNGANLYLSYKVVAN